MTPVPIAVPVTMNHSTRKTQARALSLALAALESNLVQSASISSKICAAMSYSSLRYSSSASLSLTFMASSSLRRLRVLAPNPSTKSRREIIREALAAWRLISPLSLWALYTSSGMGLSTA